MVHTAGPPGEGRKDDVGGVRDCRMWTRCTPLFRQCSAWTSAWAARTGTRKVPPPTRRHAVVT